METVHEGKSITNRALRIFAVSLLFLIASAVYFVEQRINVQHQNDFHLLTSLFFSIVFLFTTVLSFIAIARRPFFGPGSEPKYTLNRTVAESENQMAAFLLNECNDYQFRISHNNRVNAKRSFYTEMALYLLLVLPGAVVAAWLLS